jgi:ACS family glucarate transporter-like MFS transporter
MNEPNLPLPTATVAPTRVRYGVLGFACALSMITYLDRVCFGTAAPAIVRALGLSSVGDLKWAITGFVFAYAIFEIPSGWLGDVFGPRRTLIRIVIWWSLFTALTGLVTRDGFLMFPLAAGAGLAVLVTVRFLFGVGEAGAYPNITRALHNWMPFRERGLGQGAVWMAGRLMGGLTPLVWWLIVETLQLSWRTAFGLFAVMGALWCVAFAFWFRNRPDEKPEVNAAERQLILADRHDVEAAHLGVPWLRLLTSLNLWALCLMYFCAGYGWYFNITYLPSFLETQYSVQPGSALGAIYKGGPLLAGAVTCLLGGVLTDRLTRRTGDRKWGRRIFGVVGHALCGLSYFACLYTSSAFTFFLAISLAAFWNDLTMGSAWAVCQDIGRRHAAIVAGCMNTIGNLGGAVSGWLTGTLLQRALESRAVAEGVTVGALRESQKAEALLPGYQANFVIFGVVYLLAVGLWLLIDATRPVLAEDAQPERATD